MKLGNFLKVAAVIAGGILISAIVVKKFKKELNNTERSKKESDDDNDSPDDSGMVGEDDISEEKTGCMVKDILINIKKSPDWDVNRVMIQPGIEFAAHTIHVRQSIRDLDFLIEIPRLDNGNYNLPEMRDFINEFKSSTDYIWENIVKFSERPFGVLEGYLVLSFEYDNDPKHERRYMYGKLPREAVARFRKTGVQEKDSWVLTRCVTEIRKSLDNKDVNLINSGEDTDDRINIRIEDVKLVWRVSFRIRLESEIGRSSIGITSELAEKCLKYLIDDMEVVGNRNKSYRYEQIVFYKSFGPEVEAYEPVETKEGRFKIESFLLDFGDER